MPINWNEIDRLKLEYIQNKEAVEAEYKKECLACENSFFRFKKPEKPKELYSDYYDEYLFYKNEFIIVEGDRIILYFLDELPKSTQNIIIKYLDTENNVLILSHGNKKNYKFMYDTDENRKKIDKVLASFEKYIEEENKKVEAFIDNYINDKEGK